MSGGTLPKTGISALVIGGAAIEYPVWAAVGAGLILAGFVLLRFARPTRLARK